MKTILLPLAILVALSIHGLRGQNNAKTTTQAPVRKDVNTSGVVSNVAYFHMLYSFGIAKVDNPLDSLLKLKLDDNLCVSAKARAMQCPSIDERHITVGNNLTEFFLVSEIKKHNLTASARKRLRENEKEWPNVMPSARIIHAAFYTDMSDTSFDNATLDEQPDLGQAMDAYYLFGCDMADCKEEGKWKAIIVCHATRDVPPKKKIISKAEYDELYGNHDEPKSRVGTRAASFFVLSLALFHAHV